MVCRFFDDGHSDRCEMIPHCSFDLHFSRNQWCSISFHVFVGHFYVFFAEMAYWGFLLGTRILNWVIALVSIQEEPCRFLACDGSLIHSLSEANRGRRQHVHADTHPTRINILDWPRSSFGFFCMLLWKTQMNFLGQIQQINTNIFGGLYKQKNRYGRLCNKLITEGLVTSEEKAWKSKGILLHLHKTHP